MSVSVLREEGVGGAWRKGGTDEVSTWREIRKEEPDQDDRRDRDRRDDRDTRPPPREPEEGKTRWSYSILYQSLDAALLNGVCLNGHSHGLRQSITLPL